MSIQSLDRLGLSTFEIGESLGLPEQQVAEIVEEINHTVHYAEKEYHETEYPNVLTSIAEWLAEFSPLEKREFRRRYLLEKLKERNPKELSRVKREIRIFNGEVKGITADMLERAKSYPIQRLLGTKQTIVKCLFHDDATPSMDIRKNFYSCYGCGAHGDAIDLAMKLKRMTFIQAVNFLQ